MVPLSKILLPVDFSERCLGAARYAESLAAHFQAEIGLLHVVEPLRYDFGELEFAGSVANEVMRSRAALARQQLEAFLESELAGARVSRVLLEGDPARRIVEYAHEQQVGLIAMPTHGYGPFRRFILGSVTAKVLHDADCPVLTGVHLEGAPGLPRSPCARFCARWTWGRRAARRCAGRRRWRRSSAPGCCWRTRFRRSRRGPATTSTPGWPESCPEPRARNWPGFSRTCEPRPKRWSRAAIPRK